MRISDWSSDVCSSDLEATGNNAIIVCPGAAALISPADIEAQGDLIRGAGVFVTQLEQPVEAALRALEIAREAGVTTILNPAPAAELPAEIYRLCDYVTPNETEAEGLTGVKVESLDDARRRSEEHTSELQSLMRTSYAVFSLNTK